MQARSALGSLRHGGEPPSHSQRLVVEWAGWTPIAMGGGPPEQGRNAAGFPPAAIERYEGSPRGPFPRRSAERAVEQRRLELLARWLAGNSLAGCFPELAHGVRLQEQR